MYNVTLLARDVLHHEFTAHDFQQLPDFRSVAFTFAPTFFVTNLLDLESSRIHRFCVSTCFALRNPLLLTKHIVAVASRCRFNPHTMPKSFATH